MDAGTVGAISTVLVTIAFFGVCLWAFSPKLKKRFEDDAKLPFADDEKTELTAKQPENKQTDDRK
ncbi:CcoQ/FixQ family Cbb3-type cytochrome c oxidase assembly chaperone [Cellvibrio sp. pealriver]|uniref:CcoQ/FixQ family Cbb3-type cytochrome c oxidase assembly chaperone n=1 Tax=Cellvibrio sp. pealriver TaxID=1622269 RepID=UPI00066FD56C|nr:CcoQ/FixQ family Cbb3-type cytochrome c oxidase assembly chaperone [Cellvibrio sp. pealriver]